MNYLVLILAVSISALKVKDFQSVSTKNSASSTDLPKSVNSSKFTSDSPESQKFANSSKHFSSATESQKFVNSTNYDTTDSPKSVNLTKNLAVSVSDPQKSVNLTRNFTASVSNPQSVNSVNSTKNFAFNLYSQASKNFTSNFIASPLAAATLLNLVSLGSKGSTNQQILNLLSSQDQDSVKNLSHLNQSEAESTVFEAETKLFYPSNFAVAKSFSEKASDLNVELQSLNFGDPDKARIAIVEWLRNHTNSTVTSILDSSQFNSSTKLVLFNSIDLSSNWVVPFVETDTKKENFQISQSKGVQVDTMHLNQKSFEYCEASGAQFLNLPLQGPNASVTFALPTKNETLENLEKNLTTIIAKIDWKSTNLNISIPKFRFKSEVDLTPILKNLGVTSLFTSDADLSGIGGKKGDLVVNRFAQKASIHVTEEGLGDETSDSKEGNEATNSTVQEAKSFVADRPFVFWVRFGGAVVFVGKVTEP